jgi:hypothetical protein
MRYFLFIQREPTIAQFDLFSNIPLLTRPDLRGNVALHMRDDPLANAGTNIVVCWRNPKAKPAIVGETPGPQGNIQGKPFIGRADQLLAKILLAVDSDPERDIFTTLGLAISSSLALVAEVFDSVLVADPTAAALVAVAFVPFPVVSLAVFVPLAAIFVSVPVPALVPAALVFAAQVHLAASVSSRLPSFLNT